MRKLIEGALKRVGIAPKKGLPTERITTIICRKCKNRALPGEYHECPSGVPDSSFHAPMTSAEASGHNPHFSVSYIMIEEDAEDMRRYALNETGSSGAVITGQTANKDVENVSVESDVEQFSDKTHPIQNSQIDFNLDEEGDAQLANNDMLLLC